MRHFPNVFFACSLLLGFLGGCSGCANSEKSVSFRTRIQNAEKQSDPNLRAKQLIRIAGDQIQARDLSGAAKTLRTAETACLEISEPLTKAYAYALLIEGDAALGNKNEARRDFEGAWKTVDSIDDKDAKVRAMARLGQAQGAIKDDASQAAETIRKAEKLTDELPDPLNRGLAQITVAEAFGKIGNSAEADRVIARILQSAESIPEGRSHVQLLAKTAVVQHVLKQKETAEKTFALAIETAEKLDNPLSQTNALADVAEQTSKTGNAKRTHQLLDQAEKAAAKIPERDLQQQTLYRVHSLMEKLPK